MVSSLVALLVSPAAQGQTSSEVEQLRKENELFKKEIKKEMELLKKEMELLKNGKSEGKSSSTNEDKMGTDNEHTEYELIKCVRIGTSDQVVFHFSAVNKEQDVTLGGAFDAKRQGLPGVPRPWNLSLTGRDGASLKHAKVVFEPKTPAVQLKKGIAEKFQITAKGIDTDVSVLETVSLSYEKGLLVRTDPVKFRNIKIEKEKAK